MLTPALAQSLLVLGITPDMLRERGLQPCAEAPALVRADTGPDGRPFLLQPEAAAAWQAMKVAAAREDIALELVSAFRSVGRQEEIVREKLATGQAIEEVLRWVAPPGFSEHHGGMAVDIAVAGEPALSEAFEATPAYAWLSRHAAAYGFHLSYPRTNPLGYGFEPWHWCWRRA